LDRSLQYRQDREKEAGNGIWTSYDSVRGARAGIKKMNEMNEWITHTWNSIISSRGSKSFDTALDSIILILAFLPALYLYSRFLFGDASRARELARSPRLMGWLIFFCGFEVLLHLIKVPIIWKIVVALTAFVIFPLLFFLEKGIRWSGAITALGAANPGRGLALAQGNLEIGVKFGNWGQI
jgi:hypothetical protein